MRKRIALIFALVAAFAVMAVPAFAQTLDPLSEVTTLTGTAVDALGPIMIAVATAAIGLAVLWFGIKFVYKLVRSGGRSV